jgi:hypothetical protein
MILNNATYLNHFFLLFLICSIAPRKGGKQCLHHKKSEVQAAGKEWIDRSSCKRKPKEWDHLEITDEIAAHST